MKSTFKLTILRRSICIVIVGWGVSSYAGHLANVKYYDIEEGRVDYALTGLSQGTMTLEFKEWGRRSAIRTQSTVSIMGMTQTRDDLIITDGPWVYTVDMGTRTAIKMENPVLKELAGRRNSSRIQTGRDIIIALGGKEIGTGTVSGKTCVLWENQQMMSTSCVWKGLSLKTTSVISGMKMTQTAVDIQIGSIPDSHVLLPDGVQIRESPDPNQLLDGMLQNNSDPQKEAFPEPAVR